MSEERRQQKSAERDKEAAAPVEEFKIFVGGISWHMDDRELKDTFKRFGASDARVMLDRSTNRSRGFGFVHFDNKEDMEDAIAKMHGTEVDGRKISVNRAIPQESIQPGTPATSIGRRGSDRGGSSRYDRPPRGGYDRPPPRGSGYDRGGPYERYAPDYPYERAPGPSSYGYGYERDYPPRDSYARVDPYDRYGFAPPDPYERDPYYGAYGAAVAAQTGYGPAMHPYEGRGGFPDRYDPERRGGYERYSRAGGPDRDYGRYGGSASRAAPYDRGGAMAGRL